MPEEPMDRTVDESRDTRGPIEKIADTVTNDRVDDKTGNVIRDEGPNWQIGDRPSDSRGTGERVADTITGDRIDDKSGQPVSDGEAYDPDDVARRSDWIDPETDLELEPRAYEPNENRDALERAADALTGDSIDDPVPRRQVP